MKKIVLLTCSVCIGVLAYAQTMQNNPAYVAKKTDFSKKLDRTVAPYKANTQKVAGASLGQTPNVYTCAFGPKTYLWANPSLNTIVFSHRADNGSTGDNTNGAIRYDLSIDGGTTWTNNIGPVWNPVSTTGYTVPGMGRFPQSVIYNPPGNTNPDNAYFTYYAPTLNASNGGGPLASWGGHVHGVHPLNGATAPTATEISSDAAQGMFYVTGEDFTIADSTGTVYSLDQSGAFNPNLGTDGRFIYRDSLVLSTGTWDAMANDFVYTRSLIPAPVAWDTSGTDGVDDKALVDAKIAFAPDGLTGYISMIGYSGDPSVSVYGVYHPIFYKTVDGGTTWTGPMNVNLNAIPGIFADYSFPTDWTVTDLTAGFEHDLVVDKNGNAHMICNVSAASATTTGPNLTPQDFAIYSAAGIQMMQDIHTTDGGTTWVADTLRKPETFRGDFGTAPDEISEDNRPHASRTVDGSQLIFSWFETDIDLWDVAEGNLHPDVYMKGYNVDNGTWGNTYNMTTGTVDDSRLTYGNVSHYIFDNGDGTYSVPVVYEELFNSNPANISDPAQLYHINALYHPTSVGINEIEKNAISVKSYPNPVKSTASLEIVLTQAGEATLTLVNLMGQSVLSKDLGRLSHGHNNFTLDVSSLEAGAYFYTVQIGTQSVTQKMIVE